MEQIAKIISKISKYEILNNLIPGVVLCYILIEIGYAVWVDNVLFNIVISYFVGMVCSRFSSLCIEEPFKMWGWIKWKEYDEYNRAKKERPFISLLQENANMYRAMVGTFALSLLAMAYHTFRLYCDALTWIDKPLLILLLLLLYVFSYRKQINDYVVKNIEEVNEQTKK